MPAYLLGLLQGLSEVMVQSTHSRCLINSVQVSPLPIFPGESLYMRPHPDSGPFKLASLQHLCKEFIIHSGLHSPNHERCQQTGNGCGQIGWWLEASSHWPLPFPGWLLSAHSYMFFLSWQLISMSSSTPSFVAGNSPWTAPLPVLARPCPVSLAALTGHSSSAPGTLVAA